MSIFRSLIENGRHRLDMRAGTGSIRRAPTRLFSEVSLSFDQAVKPRPANPTSAG
jgi:hypothetical protein